MRTPLAPGFIHMRPGLITAKGRRRRYRRAGGCAPPRAVPIERVTITTWAIGPVPAGWRPRRHWILEGYTPPPVPVRTARPKKPKPETRQLALGL